MSDNPYVASLSDAIYPDRICIIKREEISHIIGFIYELQNRKLIPEELRSEYKSAEAFCQRTLATPLIQNIIFEDNEYNERIHNDGLLSESITVLKLGIRGRKCLHRLGIKTVGQLTNKSSEDLLKCRDFGVSSLWQIKQRLAEIDMKLDDY